MSTEETEEQVSCHVGAVDFAQDNTIPGRSYLAYLLTPEPPIYDWLEDLNGWISQAPGYFVGKPIILDLSAVTLSHSAILQLVDQLQVRDIRIMGLEGVDPQQVGPDLPPLLAGGRPVAVPEPQELAPHASRAAL